jgi:hypothetical protein
MVIKTIAYSAVWYLGSLWDCPPDVAKMLRSMARHFFWKGWMPKGVMHGAPLSAYSCNTPIRSQWVAADLEDGGYGLWDATDQLTAMHAQWVHRAVKPAGPSSRERGALAKPYAQLGERRPRCHHGS